MTEFLLMHRDYLFSCRLPVTCAWNNGRMRRWLRWWRGKNGDVVLLPDEKISQIEEVVIMLDEPPF